VQPTPKSDPVPGDPADLFDFALFPCNICIHTREEEIEGIKLAYEAELPNHPDWDPWPADIPPDWKTVLVPATTEPTWLCNSAVKTGCYDLCRIEPPAVFVVDREPAEIIGLLPPTPEYDDERVQLAKCHP
jgi:hypothetical protein